MNTANTHAKETPEPMPTTARLMKMLETSPNRFKNIQVESEYKDMQFHEYLFHLLEKKKVQIPQMVKACCISKAYAYQFINGERLPGRDMVLRISFFLRIKVDETQRLLTLAGKNILYPKIRRDASILFALQKKMTLDEVNSFLDELGEETLL